MTLPVYQSIIQRVRRYQRNYITRRQLLQLDAVALKDIGISRAEALAEARKPFWKDSAQSQSVPVDTVQISVVATAFSGFVIALMWFS